jgi:hypothetical protein
LYLVLILIASFDPLAAPNRFPARVPPAERLDPFSRGQVVLVPGPLARGVLKVRLLIMLHIRLPWRLRSCSLVFLGGALSGTTLTLGKGRYVRGRSMAACGGRGWQRGLLHFFVVVAVAFIPEGFVILLIV